MSGIVMEDIDELILRDTGNQMRNGIQIDNPLNMGWRRLFHIHHSRRRRRVLLLKTSRRIRHEDEFGSIARLHALVVGRRGQEQRGQFDNVSRLCGATTLTILLVLDNTMIHA